MDVFFILSLLLNFLREKKKRETAFEWVSGTFLFLNKIKFWTSCKLKTLGGEILQIENLRVEIVSGIYISKSYIGFFVVVVVVIGRPLHA